MRLSGVWRSRNSSARSACPVGGPAVCCWVTVEPELPCSFCLLLIYGAVGMDGPAPVSRGRARPPRAEWWLLAPADLGSFRRRDALDAVDGLVGDELDTCVVEVQAR